MLSVTAGSMLLMAMPVCFCPLYVCERACACVCLNIITACAFGPACRSCLCSADVYAHVKPSRKAVSTLVWHHMLFPCQEVCSQALICCEINCLWACMASPGVHNQPQLSGGGFAPRRTAAAACTSCACCAGEPGKPYKRVIMFVDNAGADILLGMLPLARCFTCHSYCNFM